MIRVHLEKPRYIHTIYGTKYQYIFWGIIIFSPVWLYIFAHFFNFLRIYMAFCFIHLIVICIVWSRTYKDTYIFKIKERGTVVTTI